MSWLTWKTNPRISLPEDADIDDADFVAFGDIQKEYNKDVEEGKFWEKEQDRNLMYYHVDLDNLPEDITFEGR